MILKDKVAIITGGSRGIGFVTVKTFLDAGAKVVLCASRQETADKAISELKAVNPNYEVEAIWPDLGKMDEVQSAFDQVAQKYGSIDILVNNAGVSESTPFDKYTDETFVKVMDLNLKGVYHCSKAVVEQMTKQGGGVILNTSSMVSLYGQPSGVAYPTSKFAVNGFTLSLARELGPRGIRVNAVAPGITNTDMMRAVPKETIDAMQKQIPLRRLGQPEDIANAFLFLASDMAGYITGDILHVDGLARS